MKIKWNWGTGIFITIVVMISFLAFLVSKTFEYKINKVTEDYYERGLHHNDQIERVNNSRTYKMEFDVIHTDVCTVHFPSFFADKKMDGEILFFRPSDFSEDKTFEIALDTNSNQIFSLDHFLKGKYIVKTSFTSEDIDYYFEKIIIF